MIGVALEQLVVTRHARMRYIARMRRDLRRAPARDVEAAIRDVVSHGRLRYGAPSWRPARRATWMVEALALATRPDCDGLAPARVALLLVCDLDAWWVTTVLVPTLRLGRAARVFAPAWEAIVS